MAMEQMPIFGEDDSQKMQPLDLSKVADHMASHAPGDPYREAADRAKSIIEQRDGEDLAAEQGGAPLNPDGPEGPVGPKGPNVLTEGERIYQEFPDRPGEKVLQAKNIIGAERNVRPSITDSEAGRQFGKGLPTPSEVQKGMSEAAIAAQDEMNKSGAQSAREALNANRAENGIS